MTLVEKRDNMKALLQAKVNVFVSRAELLRKHMEGHKPENGSSESGEEGFVAETKDDPVQESESV